MLISKLCRIQEMSSEDAGMRLSGGRIPALAKTWSRWVMEWVWRGGREERGLDMWFFFLLLFIKGYRYDMKMVFSYTRYLRLP